MYVAVKGGQKAIRAAHRQLAKVTRGSLSVPELTVSQLGEQLSLAVDRVQAEGALYAPEMAALAVKQARGDLVEAGFLLRAARATLERFGYSEPIKTAQMRPKRRISSTFKDLPGGQILGPTFDYTHRLLDRNLLGSMPDTSSGSPAEAVDGTENFSDSEPKGPDEAGDDFTMPAATDYLVSQGLLEEAENPAENRDCPFDLTREPLMFPQKRAGRLQALARADEGFLLALAYSTQRGYGAVHPFVAELRLGSVEVEFLVPETETVITIGRLEVTECQTVNRFKGGGGRPPMFTRGYGLVYGHNERKALSMAIVDRALKAKELGEAIKGPAQDEEFVLSHSDNVEASGFVSHIKLPHYVDFQAELAMLRHMRAGSEHGNPDKTE
jgi:alpha-D-ribose 1-methylphosphonate 5-triphosphate synthase subunit PhnI